MGPHRTTIPTAATTTAATQEARVAAAARTGRPVAARAAVAAADAVGVADSTTISAAVELWRLPDVLYKSMFEFNFMKSRMTFRPVTGFRSVVITPYNSSSSQFQNMLENYFLILA